MRLMGFGPHAFSPEELVALLAAERRGAPFLAYRDEAGDLRLVELSGAARLTVGREGSDLSLGWDPEVSRAHAQLESLGESWTLVDDGLSRNGSFLNGERVTGRRRLADRDVLRFGHTAVLFRSPGVGTVETAAASDAGELIELTPAQRRVLVALCRPFARPGLGATPASNSEIAGELCLSLDGVKTQIRALFAKLGIEDLPQNRKRAELARRALELGLVGPRELQHRAGSS